MFAMKSDSLAGIVFVGLFLLPFQFVTSYEQKWDYFMFAQSWPPGTCADAHIKNHTCHIGSQVKTWTIHGLWPSLGSTWPSCCNDSWPFDLSKIASLKQELRTYWPNLYNDTSIDWFWEHEWEQHGTCSTSLPATSNEYKYFKTTLSLNRKYDVGKMLADSGVKPSETTQYSYNDFVNAVKKAIGYEPVIQCTTRKQKNGEEYHLIDQVQICLNKDFTPRSCSNGTIYPSGSYHSKGNNSTLDFEKGEKNYLIGTTYSHQHYHGPKSSCSKEHSLNYPPIHQV